MRADRLKNRRERRAYSRQRDTPSCQASHGSMRFSNEPAEAVGHKSATHSNMLPPFFWKSKCQLSSSPSGGGLLFGSPLKFLKVTCTTRLSARKSRAA